MAEVRISPAHKALKSLVDQLNELGNNDLLLLKKPDNPPILDGLRFSQDGPEWRRALRHALVELETWCDENSPGEPFTIDVPPKPPE